MFRILSKGKGPYSLLKNNGTARQRRTDSGFTLPEILVSLTILALIAGMTAVFLGQLKQAARIHAEWDAQYELDSVVRYVERALESTLALPIDIQENNSRLFFRGTSSKLEFVNASRIGIQEAALRTNSIGLDSGKIVQRIKIRRFSRASSSSDEALKVTILDGVSDVRFEYFGKADRSEDPVWSDRWNSERSLPTSVRFAVTARKDNRVLKSRGIALIGSRSN